VGQIHATFAHPGHQVSIAQFVGEVPADIENHDFLVKVTTLELNSASNGTNRHILSFCPSQIPICTRTAWGRAASPWIHFDVHPSFGDFLLSGFAGRAQLSGFPGSLTAGDFNSGSRSRQKR
jgi:hypothetical protein